LISLRSRRFCEDRMSTKRLQLIQAMHKF